MQQRRLRLGDILDDYCSRERRITNHVVVAMIEEEVKQTRCTTCDAEHEYKAARMPLRRRRPDTAGGDPAEGLLRPRAASEAESQGEGAGADESPADVLEAPPLDHMAADAVMDGDAQADTMSAAGADDGDGPVHRRLIRATLPRPEGQLPERKAPDFTIRQPGGRGGGGRGEFDGNRMGQRPGQGPRPMRTHGGSQQPTRFGGPRHDGSGGSRAGSGQGRPPGNRPGNPSAPRGNRPGQGAGRSGGGRKRGR